MNPWRLGRRSRRRGVAEILGAILLVALTITAGVILWSFRIHTPPAPPSVAFAFETGGSNPVWGDPTDYNNGVYSLLNTSQIIVQSVSPTDIPATEVELTFLCNGAYGQAGPGQGGIGPGNNLTILIQGSLASMTWYPGYGTYPTSGPKLGWCANFNAGGYGGGANGVFFNRLGLFDPLQQGSTIVSAGDTFVLYIHSGCTPLDNGHCDTDDYHGAPPWCFTDPGACTIVLTYTGNPSTTLATISLTSLAPPPS